eukprot:jgi/Ulvmu1/11431/UM076_0005.1
MCSMHACLRGGLHCVVAPTLRRFHQRLSSNHAHTACTKRLDTDDRLLCIASQHRMAEATPRRSRTVHAAQHTAQQKVVLLHCDRLSAHGQQREEGREQIKQTLTSSTVTVRISTGHTHSQVSGCAGVTEGCPPDDFMCVDPGLLTCATPELNDCNMHGDCRGGRCFCHIGWGSADCSLQVCTTSCPDGSACPPSGFCGVPECGEWSVGDEGKGVPCTEN